MPLVATCIIIAASILGILSVCYYKEKSNSDKIITIICALVPAIISIWSTYSSSSINGPVVSGDNSGQVVIGDNTTITITNNNEIKEKTIEDNLLFQAEICYSSGDYEKAVAIYSREELKDDPHAKLALGYMYTHGEGVALDYDQAMAYYNEIVDVLPQARKNRLALMIIRNNAPQTKGKYADRIISEIENLWKENDSDVKEYIKSMLVLSNKEADAEHLQLDISDLYHYNYCCLLSVTNPPSNTGYYSYFFVGAHYEDIANGSQLKYTYKKFELANLSLIETVR